ncbi:hypothetical protein DFA_02270 [Cavenderia fasciculata]|uniref:Uncharacterized protein n=1 Tax=Cavenderia fasciculata TaxID=261658 RepID=F4PYZ8_CACFS|nr:uncharacterized protein DFA_02270 [Cavenderia fasciculata]EGG19027.1 hypothetical protein DFA_02270 [Cavenderia fasciculata]|eukprot:XP_004366660.1 hypothetical protein DFA_02270 [Cavenderia fasciculata]
MGPKKKSKKVIKKVTSTTTTDDRDLNHREALPVLIQNKIIDLLVNERSEVFEKTYITFTDELYQLAKVNKRWFALISSRIDQVSVRELTNKPFKPSGRKVHPLIKLLKVQQSDKYSIIRRLKSLLLDIKPATTQEEANCINEMFRKIALQEKFPFTSSLEHIYFPTGWWDEYDIAEDFERFFTEDYMRKYSRGSKTTGLGFKMTKIFANLSSITLTLDYETRDGYTMLAMIETIKQHMTQVKNLSWSIETGSDGEGSEYDSFEPLWDHSTTNFNLEQLSIDCYGMQMKHLYNVFRKESKLIFFKAGAYRGRAQLESNADDLDMAVESIKTNSTLTSLKLGKLYLTNDEKIRIQKALAFNQTITNLSICQYLFGVSPSSPSISTDILSQSLIEFKYIELTDDLNVINSIIKIIETNSHPNLKSIGIKMDKTNGDKQLEDRFTKALKANTTLDTFKFKYLYSFRRRPSIELRLQDVSSNNIDERINNFWNRINNGRRKGGRMSDSELNDQIISSIIAASASTKSSSSSSVLHNSNSNVYVQSDCECSHGGYIDKLLKLQLETLEFIELPSPTNIYSFSYLDAHQHSVLSPSLTNSNKMSSQLMTTTVPSQLLVASRSNLLSIHSEENLRNGSLNWVTNEVISPLHFSPKLNPLTNNNTSTTNLLNSPGGGGNNTNVNNVSPNSNKPLSPPPISTTSSTSAASGYVPLQSQPSQQQIQQHLSRLPLSHKHKMPPLSSMKSPSAPNISLPGSGGGGGGGGTAQQTSGPQSSVSTQNLLSVHGPGASSSSSVSAVSPLTLSSNSSQQQQQQQQQQRQQEQQQQQQQQLQQQQQQQQQQIQQQTQQKEDTIISVDSIVCEGGRSVLAIAIISGVLTTHRACLSFLTYDDIITPHQPLQPQPSSSSSSSQQTTPQKSPTSQTPNQSSPLLQSSNIVTNNLVKTQNIYLDFVPYQLIHTTCNIVSGQNNKNQQVFLLSGSDEKIHLYHLNEHNEYIEGDLSKYFPEMVNLPSLALKIEIVYYLNYRLVAIGFQSGYLQLTITNLDNNNVTTDSYYFDGPVQAISIFSDKNDIHFDKYQQQQSTTPPIISSQSTSNGSKLKMKSTIDSSYLNDLILKMKEEKEKEKDNQETNYTRDQNEQEEEEEVPKLNLLAASVIGYAMIFRNILNNQLKEPALLDHSDSFDSLTCVEVFDIDGDGENELIIGSYSRELLVYKYQGIVDKYTLYAHKHFSYPILGLLKCKLLNDSLYQFIVISMFGIYIMRSPIKHLEDEMKEKLKYLKEILEN